MARYGSSGEITQIDERIAKRAPVGKLTGALGFLLYGSCWNP